MDRGVSVHWFKQGVRTHHCRVRDTRLSCLGALALMWQFILRRSSFPPLPMPSSAKQCRTAWTGGTVFKRYSVAECRGVRALPSRAKGVWRAHRISAPTSTGLFHVSVPRCMSFRGSFVFPWIGTWTRRGTVVVPGSSAAQAPLLSYGLDPDQHFQAALAVGQSPLQPPVLDLDLQFAAALTGTYRDHECAVGATKQSSELNQPP